MNRKKVIQMLLMVVAILLFGTIGYQAVEPGYSFFDSLYMTVITVTTIGYGEIKRLSTTGRVFNMILIAVGWTGIFLVARMAGQMIVEGQVIKLFGRHRMDKKIASMKGHYIVCGSARYLRDLAKAHVPVSGPFDAGRHRSDRRLRADGDA